MNNPWKFGALFAGDIKLITADLFVGTHQFILSLHVYSIFCINQNNYKTLVHLCVNIYLRWLICCSKVAVGGKSCSKLLAAQKVVQNSKSCQNVAGHNLYRPIPYSTWPKWLLVEKHFE